MGSSLLRSSYCGQSHLDIVVGQFPGIFPEDFSHLSQSVELDRSSVEISDPGLLSPGTQERSHRLGQENITAGLPAYSMLYSNVLCVLCTVSCTLPDGEKCNEVPGQEREGSVPLHQTVAGLLVQLVVLGVELQHPGELQGGPVLSPGQPVRLVYEDPHGLWCSCVERRVAADCPSAELVLLPGPLQQASSLTIHQERGDLNCSTLPYHPTSTPSSQTRACKLLAMVVKSWKTPESDVTQRGVVQSVRNDPDQTCRTHMKY